MLSFFWIFVGAITGLLVTAVFNPPLRPSPDVPHPNEDTSFKTKSGCVKFRTEEVPCSDNATSLNFIASQHK
jgi:hypothetical protein